MKCATHTDIESNLRCGRCGKLICPRCMVQTPVGARCAHCARLSKLPTYNVSISYYFRAIVVALVISVVAGIVWVLVRNFIPFLYLNLLIAPGIGYGIGEAISFSVNRKRGKGLATIAGIAVVLSYLVTFAFVVLPFFNILNFAFDLFALGLGVFSAISRLR